MTHRRWTGEGAVVHVSKKYAFVNSDTLETNIYCPVQADIWGKGDMRERYNVDDEVVLCAESQTEKENCKFVATAVCPKSEQKTLQGTIVSVDRTFGVASTKQGKVFFTSHSAHAPDLMHKLKEGSLVTVTAIPQQEQNGCAMFATRVSKVQEPRSTEKERIFRKMITGLEAFVIENGIDEIVAWNREIGAIKFKRSLVVRQPFEGVRSGTWVKMNVRWCDKSQQWQPEAVENLLPHQQENKICTWLDDSTFRAEGVGIVCQLAAPNRPADASRSPLYRRTSGGNSRTPTPTQGNKHESRVHYKRGSVRIWNDELGMMYYGDETGAHGRKPDFLTVVKFSAELQFKFDKEKMKSFYKWQVTDFCLIDSSSPGCNNLLTHDMGIEFTTANGYGFAQDPALGRVYFNQRSLSGLAWSDVFPAIKGQMVRVTMYKQFSDATCDWCAVLATPLDGDGTPTRPHAMGPWTKEDRETKTNQQNHLSVSEIDVVEDELRSNRTFSPKYTENPNLVRMDLRSESSSPNLMATSLPYCFPPRPYSPVVSVNRPLHPGLPFNGVINYPLSPVFPIHPDNLPNRMMAPNLPYVPISNPYQCRGPTYLRSVSTLSSTKTITSDCDNAAQAKAKSDAGTQCDSDELLLFVRDIMRDQELQTLIFKKFEPERLCSVIQTIR